MRRLITMAMSAGVILAGGGPLAAQGVPAAPARPFSNVFTTAPPSPEVPPALRDGVRKALTASPSRRRILSDSPGTKCHMIVVPADPAIDPHFSVAPQSTTRFLLREERTDHFCR